ncbi:hypothetical protein AB0G04_10065 [Actinoplanes sp. NPDC023801]|uniref:hypothetical protein n=1 Tax=Actinoplanes sp. NPDC023801 TaxID=3154595 RepID=UPI0033DD23C2
MRQTEWAQRYREPGTWRREFGPETAPVPVVAASPELVEACGLIDDLIRGDPRFVLVQAPCGSGKSTLIAAALAAFDEDEVAYEQIQIGHDHDPGPLMKRLSTGNCDAIIVVDNCDDLTPATLQKLVKERAKCRGLLLTATKVKAEITSLLDGEHDRYLRVPHLQERPVDLLMVTAMIWEEQVGPPLAEACDESATEAILGGPYARGAWSIEAILTGVADLLQISGDLADGRLQRKMTSGDLLPHVLQHVREQITPTVVAPTDAVVVVEGETDAIYLEAAAAVALTDREWRLLDGLRIESPPGRSGGGDAVVYRLLNLHQDGVSGLGLFDRDSSGDAAYRLAGQHKDKIRRYLLPARFDPLKRDEQSAILEIEDLLPVELLERYYREHPDRTAEERHWRKGRWRIVPLGEDKGELAEWVRCVATFADLERFMWLLAQIRQELKLPVPPTMADKAWIAGMEQRPADASEPVMDVPEPPPGEFDEPSPPESEPPQAWTEPPQTQAESRPPESDPRPESGPRPD